MREDEDVTTRLLDELLALGVTDVEDVAAFIDDPEKRRAFLAAANKKPFDMSSTVDERLQAALAQLLNNNERDPLP